MLELHFRKCFKCLDIEMRLQVRIRPPMGFDHTGHYLRTGLTRVFPRFLKGVIPVGAFLTARP